MRRTKAYSSQGGVAVTFSVANLASINASIFLYGRLKTCPTCVRAQSCRWAQYLAYSALASARRRWLIEIISDRRGPSPPFPPALIHRKEILRKPPTPKTSLPPGANDTLVF